jgi:hypothetical protein
MAKSLASMSVDALLKLRNDIGAMLGKKSTELQRQLARLGGTAVGNGRKGKRLMSLEGRRSPEVPRAR